jgi:hypothetical protein
VNYPSGAYLLKLWCQCFFFFFFIGIPMGTNCAPLLADLFAYSYESEFLPKLGKDKNIHEARALAI